MTANTDHDNEHRLILGTRVDGTSYHDAAETVINLARARQSGYLCAANVHMIMEAYRDPQFQRVVNDAVLVTPDGMPLVWTLRELGLPEQPRVYGPTLMLRVCEAAAGQQIAVGLYGSTNHVLQKLNHRLLTQFPALKINYQHAPPYRTLTPEERDGIRKDIEASGTQILFVGLGCPKQEFWMAENTTALSTVMLGVGAAFDFHAGTLPQAPPLFQQMGLEWFFRLSMEPRRLWRRYLINNTQFVALMLKQAMGERRNPPRG